jgi:hypothetical protein
VPIATQGAYAYDYNKDGLTDVLIEPHNEPGGLRLYRNIGNGRFVQVFAGLFVSRSPTGQLRLDHHGCAWGDVNHDGLPDLYCSLGANKGTLTDKANELWMQQAAGGFVNQAAAFGVTDPTGPGRDVTFIDVNHDAYPDLYVTNNYRSDGLPAPNHLYINQGGKSFRDATEYGVDVQLGGLPGNQSCAQAIDYNKDGWQDLFVCGHNGVKLYRNQGGTSFKDVTTAAGIAAGAWRDAVMADMNHDGWLDIAGLNGTATQFRVQLGRPDGTFGPPTAIRTLGAGRSVAVGDTNGDGALDVYIVQGGSYPDLLLLNNGSGTSYSNATIPQITTGDGQSVTAFDYKQDGITDFLVLHGYESTKGPVELLAFPKP